jgi:hypothetical protein
MGLDLDKAAPAEADGDGAPGIEVTPEMIEAGAYVISGELGDVGGYFSAPDLAAEVYRAMACLDLSRRDPSRGQNPKG